MNGPAQFKLDPVQHIGQPSIQWMIHECIDLGPNNTLIVSGPNGFYVVYV